MSKAATNASMLFTKERVGDANPVNVMSFLYLPPIKTVVLFTETSNPMLSSTPAPVETQIKLPLPSYAAINISSPPEDNIGGNTGDVAVP